GRPPENARPVPKRHAWTCYLARGCGVRQGLRMHRVHRGSGGREASFPKVSLHALMRVRFPSGSRRACSSMGEHPGRIRKMRVRVPTGPPMVVLWPCGETEITRDYESRVGGSIPSEAARLSSSKGKGTRLRTVRCAFDSRREHEGLRGSTGKSAALLKRRLRVRVPPKAPRGATTPPQRARGKRPS